MTFDNFNVLQTIRLCKATSIPVTSETRGLRESFNKCKFHVKNY